MEKELNSYLEKIERYLRPLPVSERVDIVKEIKSEMLELQGNGTATEEILARLGDPKEMAKGYLGDVIVKDTTLTWTKVLALCAYYSLAGLSGLIVIPTLGICAPVFLVCGIAVPIMGVIKLIDGMLHLRLPYAQHIMVAGINNPVLAFAICALTGAVLFLLGWGCWKALVLYIKGMSSVKDRLSL